MASLPNPKTVTYEEWLRMPELIDARVEVVNGQIRDLPEPKWPRGEVIDNLADEVRSAPQLVAEVLSPANTRKEREEKLAHYAALGVPEVWVNHRAAILAEGTLKPQHFPAVQIDIAEIWPD